LETKLSIAIPTYNGAATIRETLDSIVSQLEDGVEIVISDNASTDETPEIVREYQSKYPMIRYLRNNENLGPDRNFDLAVRRSQGDYVWLFGDDDEIAPGGIKKVLEVLRSHNNLAAIYVNFSLYDRDSGQCLDERYLRIQHDVYCENSDTFLARVTISPNFLSSNVVRRSLWIQAKPMRYMGTYWVQYGTLLSIVPGHSSYCISTPYVINKGRNRLGDKAGMALDILLNLLEIIQGLPKSAYSRDSVAKARKKARSFLPRKISYSRRNGLSVTCPLIKRLVHQLGLSPIFWLRDMPLLLLPRFVHQLLWRFYKLKLVNDIYWKKWHNG